MYSTLMHVERRTDEGREPACANSTAGTAVELIGRWLELSELERRAFDALALELNASSERVERSTLDLSLRFQTLAAVAQAQSGRMAHLIKAASQLVLDGAPVAMNEALGSVEETLSSAVETHPVRGQACHAHGVYIAGCGTRCGGCGEVQRPDRSD